MKKCTCIKPLVAPIAWHKAYSKAVRLVEEVVGARVALKDRIPRSRSMPRSPTENFAEARRAYEEALGNLNKARIALLTDTARRPARGAGLIHKHGHRRRGSSSSRSSRSSSNSLSLSLGGDAETNAVQRCLSASTNLSIFTGPDVRLPTPCVHQRPCRHLHARWWSWRPRVKPVQSRCFHRYLCHAVRTLAPHFCGGACSMHSTRSACAAHARACRTTQRTLAALGSGPMQLVMVDASCYLV